MKKIISFASAAMLIFSIFSVNAFAYNTVVDDGASLFSDDGFASISESAEAFAENTDFSVAVVTTDDALGKTSHEYADDYYDSLIFEKGWSENGFLLLIDMDNREVYMSTAGECILTFSDSAVDYIIDSGYNDLVSGYYADCILAMLETAATQYENYQGGNYYIPDDEDYSYGDSEFSDSVIQFDGDFYEVLPDGEWIPVDEYNYDYGYNYGSSRRSGFQWSHVLFYIVIALVIAAITVFAVKSGYKNMGKGDEFDADDISLNLTNSSDNVISRNVVTTRIPRNNNHNRPGGKSGGFGGGASVHRSSGGVRHGGGGRKF